MSNLPSMLVTQWVGEDGGHLCGSLGYQPVVHIFRTTPSEYRYAVGLRRGMTPHDFQPIVAALDLYRTRIFNAPPYLDPVWVENYIDIDQAVAALTIGYNRGVYLGPPSMQHLMKWKLAKLLGDDR